MTGGAPGQCVTRFAPSPTGDLHLGHVYAAQVAWQAAKEAGGRFLLRIEDIDRARCRPEFSRAIVDDLDWLGLTPDGVTVQSQNLPRHATALDRLREMGLLYPCFCTRRDIQREIDHSAAAPHPGSAPAGSTDIGPEGPVYAGTCRTLDPAERRARLASGAAHGLRLDMAASVGLAGPLVWRDRRRGRFQAAPGMFGDVIVARKDIATSYHLAVTVDDAADGVTLVTRGVDLLPSTHIHRLLQALLGLAVPEWDHHPLVVDGDGRRLAKRDRALTVRALRARGLSPGAVLAMAGAAAKRG